MHKKKRNMLKIMTMSVIFLTLAVLTFFAYIYVKESPGGLADRMMSKALGMQDSILRIPNASTPEEALEQFRGPSEATQIVHQEPVDGGMILFAQRTNSETSSNLQLEYVRKNWFGWKWVWGGGYGTDEIDPSEFALYYMNMPKLEEIKTPFPMVFGTIEHPAIQRVIAETEQNGSINAAEAKLIKVDIEEYIWFAMLPVSEDAPYTIKVYDEEGKQVGRKRVEMASDTGSLTLGKRPASM
ncbi:hypothetical protein [Paenibacillus sp. FSL R7-0652]|uniref:hypothetical protein n=1 Tax=Paenibacillus sp. FSL R7-0652 TaxID=2921687 RepID=UPI00315B3D81